MSSDADLLAGATRRDRASVAALYDRHAARMYAVALRVTADPASASEVLVDLFAAIVDGAVSLPAGADAALWLLRLTRDRAAARQTQNARSSVDALTNATELTPRALVEAAFFSGLTVEEAATRLGASEETIRTKLREGMAGIRAQLR